MNLNYSQTTGRITKDDGDLVTEGWAGNGEGKNNPAMQGVHSVGPLPQGVYRVDPWEEQHGHLGPIVAHLCMISGDPMGRDAFFIHGPSMGENFGQESKGCIVIPREGRKCVKCLQPDTLTVTP
jgi:hypothetical protein